MTSIKKPEKIKTDDVTLFLDIFWTTAWAFFNKIKSDLIDFGFWTVHFHNWRKEQTNKMHKLILD